MMPSDQWVIEYEKAVTFARIVSDVPPSVIPLNMLTVDERRRESLKQVLTLEEKRVIALMFGVGGYDAMSMDTMCEVLNTTKPRIQATKMRAFRKLKRHQSVSFLKDYLD